MTEIKLGDPIVLWTTLFNGKSDKFPRVRLLDASFTEVAGSPFALTHVANGIYKNISFVPTIEQKYYGISEVFSDSGFLNIDQDYERDEDTFLVRKSINENIDMGEARLS